jgi:hypothetical protein
VTAAAAAVRRLDRLAGRPLPEDQYLVAFHRVWLRRDLYWVGLLLWVLLVFRYRPRTWAGEDPAERRRRQRAGLPGFVFRMLLLAAIFVAPVFSVLLYPAALLAHLPPRRPLQRGLWIVLGLGPTALLLLAIAYAAALDFVRGYALGPFVTLLLASTLVAWTVLCLRGPAEG